MMYSVVKREGRAGAPGRSQERVLTSHCQVSVGGNGRGPSGQMLRGFGRKCLLPRPVPVLRLARLLKRRKLGRTEGQLQ